MMPCIMPYFLTLVIQGLRSLVRFWGWLEDGNFVFSDYFLMYSFFPFLTLKKNWNPSMLETTGLMKISHSLWTNTVMSITFKQSNPWNQQNKLKKWLNVTFLQFGEHFYVILPKWWLFKPHIVKLWFQLLYLMAWLQSLKHSKNLAVQDFQKLVSGKSWDKEQGRKGIRKILKIYK